MRGERGSVIIVWVAGSEAVSWANKMPGITQPHPTVAFGTLPAVQYIESLTFKNGKFIHLKLALICMSLEYVTKSYEGLVQP